MIVLAYLTATTGPDAWHAFDMLRTAAAAGLASFGPGQ